MRIITAYKGGSLARVIAEAYPALTHATINMALRHRDVRINGKRAGQGALVSPGDEIRVYLDERFFEEKIEYIYKDDNIAVVNKRRGIPTVGEDGLEGMLARAVNAPVFPVHRLDSATSGIVVFALDAASQAELDAAFRERRVKKAYRVVLKGEISFQNKKFIHYFVKNSEKSLVTVLNSPAPGAVTAVCAVSAVKSAGGRTLAEVDLLTGRTHQIRAQMSHIGHPVLGDDKYGDRAWNRENGAKRLFLHSHMLKINVPSGNLAYISEMDFTSPAPFDF